MLNAETSTNSQGIVQATKAGIKSHLSLYLQSMPAIVSLVNSHGLFAFYPVLTPSLLSLKNAKVSVLVDLQRENRIPKGLETRQQINTANTDYSLRFYYFKGSLLTFRA